MEHLATPNPTPDHSALARRAAPNLEPHKVLSAALEVLNEAGFDGLTLRRVADKLQVKAAALYWHFTNKQDLVDQLAARIISEEFAASDIPAHPDWRDMLTTMGHGMYRALQRYRDGALVVARADLSKHPLTSNRQRTFDMLAQQGMSPELATAALFSVSRYTLGCVFEEQADPNTQRLATNGYPDFDPEQQYERGLEIVLAGIAAKVDHFSKTGTE
jgi:AcrR family transcriptional regulator